MSLPTFEVETLRNPKLYSDAQIRTAIRIAYGIAVVRAGHRRPRDGRFVLVEEPKGEC